MKTSELAELKLLRNETNIVRSILADSGYYKTNAIHAVQDLVRQNRMLAKQGAVLLEIVIELCNKPNRRGEIEKVIFDSIGKIERQDTTRESQDNENDRTISQAK